MSYKPKVNNKSNEIIKWKTFVFEVKILKRQFN